jgi:MOSC domain-containing protein YiiM
MADQAKRLTPILPNITTTGRPAEFPEMKLPWGMFGENFTTAGPGFYFSVLQEGEVGVGDPIELIEKDKTV